MSVPQVDPLAMDTFEAVPKPEELALGLKTVAKARPPRRMGMHAPLAVLALKVCNSEGREAQEVLVLLVTLLRAPLARSRIQNLFATAQPWPFDYSPPLAQGKALERPGSRESELSALLWKVPAATL